MFKDKKYSVIKNAISKELADFIYNYFLLKRRVASTFFQKNYISPYCEEWGHWTDKQVPNTYSNYADIAMETLLQQLKPKMEKETGLHLIETYSYARIYKHGDVLKRHKDRPSCEISTTLNLGGDPWPIYLEPEKNVGLPDKSKGITNESNNPGIKIDLKPGDMLIYSGCIFEHWRETFEGEDCAQVFLHYNNVDTQGHDNIYDNRIHLGLTKESMFMRNDKNR
tara:strand:+ start:3339 stop:4010 length:672 start_codon:yes stop_codon:yes gene_type:complete